MLLRYAICIVVVSLFCLAESKEIDPANSGENNNTADSLFLGYGLAESYFDDFEVETTKTLSTFERKIVVDIIKAARDWRLEHPGRTGTFRTDSRFYQMLVYNEPGLKNLESVYEVSLTDVGNYFDNKPTTASAVFKNQE